MQDKQMNAFGEGLLCQQSVKLVGISLSPTMCKYRHGKWQKSGELKTAPNGLPIANL